MKLVFFSLTGQTRKFVNKLGFESIELDNSNPFFSLNEPYIIIVPTYDLEVTEIINDFIETDENLSYCKGVVGIGNKNFANLYCFTAKDLSLEYKIPYLYDLEFQGTEKDVVYLTEKIDKVVELLK